MKKNPRAKMDNTGDQPMTMLRPSAILCVSAIFSLFVVPAANGQDDPLWSASFGTQYVSRHVAYGLDLSESPAVGLSADLGHVSGFTLDVGALRTLGTGGEWQNWSAGIGYELMLAETITLSAGFTHHEYSSDSANALASLSNSLSFGVGADIGMVSVGLSYDRYLGGEGASFIGADVSTSLELGPFIVVPLVQMTFVSQEVESLFLKGSKKGGGTATSTTSTVTGLSSFSLHAVAVLPVLDGLTATFHPYYLYSPSDLSSASSRFVWSLGARYSVEW